MRKSLLSLTLLVGVALPCRAAEHLVSTDLAQQRLAQQAQGRAADLDRVQELLSSPAAVETAGRLHVDLARVQAGTATLGDGELRDLAQRARALDGDPAAGLDSDIRQLLVIFLIVAIVILVLQAVD